MGTHRYVHPLYGTISADAIFQLSSDTSLSSLPLACTHPRTHTHTCTLSRALSCRVVGIGELLYAVDNNDYRYAANPPGAANNGEKVYAMSPLADADGKYTMLYYDNDDIYESKVFPDQNGNFAEVTLEFAHTDATKPVNIEDCSAVTHITWSSDKDSFLMMCEQSGGNSKIRQYMIIREAGSTQDAATEFVREWPVFDSVTSFAHSPVDPNEMFVYWESNGTFKIGLYVHDQGLVGEWNLMSPVTSKYGMSMVGDMVVAIADAGPLGVSTHDVMNYSLLFKHDQNGGGPRGWMMYSWVDEFTKENASPLPMVYGYNVIGGSNHHPDSFYIAGNEGLLRVELS